MLARCHNTSHKSFYRYGGRGVVVCQKWRNSYLEFLHDVGRSPSPSHTLERRDNNVGYEPGNVYWATWRVQSRNKSSTVSITFQGKTQVLADWVMELGIAHATLHDRLKRGWSVERAFTTPVTHHYWPNRGLTKAA